MAVQTSPTGLVRPDLIGAISEMNFGARGHQGWAALPLQNVSEITANVVRIPRTEYLRRQPGVKRAEGAGASRSNLYTGADSYELIEYTHEVPLDQIRGLYLPRLANLEAIAAGKAAEVVAMELAHDIRDTLFNETTFPVTGAPNGIDVSSSGPWANNSTGVPIDNVNTVREIIRLASGGYLPNFVLFNASVKNILNRQANINSSSVFRGARDTRDVTGAVITDELLATIFDLESVLVDRVAVNSANEGLAASNTNLYSSSYAFVGRRSTVDPTQDPQLGRTLVMEPPEMGGEASGVTTVDGLPIMIDEYWEPKTKSKVVRATLLAQPKIWDAALGRLIKIA
jgi:hypothetical protein